MRLASFAYARGAEKRTNQTAPIGRVQGELVYVDEKSHHETKEERDGGKDKNAEELSHDIQFSPRRREAPSFAHGCEPIKRRAHEITTDKSTKKMTAAIDKGSCEPLSSQAFWQTLIERITMPDNSSHASKRAEERLGDWIGFHLSKKNDELIPLRGGDRLRAPKNDHVDHHPSDHSIRIQAADRPHHSRSSSSEPSSRGR